MRLGAQRVSPEELAECQADIRKAQTIRGPRAIICLLCGRLFGALTGHLRTHKISRAEYRNKFGYRDDDPLASAEYEESLRRRRKPLHHPLLGEIILAVGSREYWCEIEHLAQLLTEYALTRDPQMEQEVARGMARLGFFDVRTNKPSGANFSLSFDGIAGLTEQFRG